MKSDDNAAQPPTSAGAANDATTVVPPPEEVATQWAWSLDDYGTVPVERQSWGLAWGQAAVFLSIGAVVALVIGVVGWMVVRAHNDSVTAGQPATVMMPAPWTPAPIPPTVTSTVVATPPPAQPTTVTVHAAPTTVTVEGPPPAHRAPNVADPAAAPDNTDDEFVAALRRAQLNVYDPAAAIRGAHSVCGQFARGRSRADIVGDVLSGSPVTPLGAVDFVADAVAFYCPQYAGR